MPITYYHFGRVTLEILSMRCVCCPRMVIIIPLEVNYIIMVSKCWETTLPSVFSLEWQKANIQIKDISSFIWQLLLHVFMHFYVIRFESKQFVRFLLLIPWIIDFLKRFPLTNLNDVVCRRTQIDTPIWCPICVLSIFNWLGFDVSTYFILRVRKIHFIYHSVTLTEEVLSWQKICNWANSL